MAMGSASELEYFLLLATDLEYMNPQNHEALAGEVARMRRMLNRLILKVQTDRRVGPRKMLGVAVE